MHYNVYVNGCSWTYGSELEGLEQNEEYRERHRWSQVIADRCGVTVFNDSQPGASNDLIVRKTMKWFAAGNTCDVALVQMTFCNRMEWMMKNRKFRSLSIGNLIRDQLRSSYDKIVFNKFNPGLIKASTAYIEHIHHNLWSQHYMNKQQWILEKILEENTTQYELIHLMNPEENILDDGEWYPNLKKEIFPLCNIIPWEAQNKDDKLLYCKNYFKDHPKELKYASYNGSHPSALGHQKIAEHFINKVELLKKVAL